MRLTFKTLDQRTRVIYFDEQKKVIELKKSLEQCSEFGVPAQDQQLIYQGRSLQDQHMVDYYKIDERKYLLFMRKRRKLLGTVADGAANAAVSKDTTTLEEQNASIVNISTADNSKDYAIWKNKTEFNKQKNYSKPLPVQWNEPKFLEIRNIVQTKPNSLCNVLKDLKKTDPEAIAFIRKHEDSFKEFLQATLKNNSENFCCRRALFSADDDEAIRRLENLCSSRQKVLQAFIRFNKNERRAADFLMRKRSICSSTFS